MHVGVDAAAADHVAAGDRDRHLAVAGDERAGEQQRTADALAQLGVEVGRVDAARRVDAPASSAPRRSTCSPRVEQLDQQHHVDDVRHVVQHDRLGRRAGTRRRSAARRSCSRRRASCRRAGSRPRSRSARSCAPVGAARRWREVVMRDDGSSVSARPYAMRRGRGPPSATAAASESGCVRASPGDVAQPRAVLLTVRGARSRRRSPSPGQRDPPPLSSSRYARRASCTSRASMICMYRISIPPERSGILPHRAESMLPGATPFGVRSRTNHR